MHVGDADLAGGLGGQGQRQRGDCGGGKMGQGLATLHAGVSGRMDATPFRNPRARRTGSVQTLKKHHGIHDARLNFRHIRVKYV